MPESARRWIAPQEVPPSTTDEALAEEELSELWSTWTIETTFESDEEDEK